MGQESKGQGQGWGDTLLYRWARLVVGHRARVLWFPQ